jgi:hypothetical protein
MSNRMGATPRIKSTKTDLSNRPFCGRLRGDLDLVFHQIVNELWVRGAEGLEFSTINSTPGDVVTAVIALNVYLSNLSIAHIAEKF